MEGTLARNWWSFVLRGALAITFALLIVAWSSSTPAALARVFGVFAIAEGALAVGATLGARSDDERPWTLVFEGAVGIGFGLVALVAPFRMVSTVAWLVASWIATVGLLEGATALGMRRHLATPRILIALSVVSLLAAAGLVLSRSQGELVTVWLLGAWSAFLGAATFVVGLTLRREEEAQRIEAEGIPSLVPTRPSRRVEVTPRRLPWRRR